MDLAVDGGDPVEVGLGDLDGGRLAGGERVGQLGGGEPGEVGHHGSSSEDPRDAEALVLDGGGAGQRLVLLRLHDPALAPCAALPPVLP